MLFLSGGMLLWPMLQRRFATMKDVGTLQATQLINPATPSCSTCASRRNTKAGSCRTRSTSRSPSSRAAAQELAKLAGRPLVVYCDRGTRSRMAAGALAKLGFNDLYSLTGGFRAWKSAGLPVES